MNWTILALLGLTLWLISHMRMATTLIGAVSNSIRETIDQGVEDTLPGLDPVFSILERSFEGVSQAAIGRAYQAKHAMTETTSGAIKWVTVGGGAVDNTTLAHSQIQTELETFPGVEDAVLPGRYQRTITLAKALFNMFLPSEFLVADSLPASVGPIVADITRGTAKNISLLLIHSFYNVGTKSVIATVGAIETDNRGTTGEVVVAIMGGSVQTFYNGLHVDLYDGATKLNTTSQVVVDGVDYLPGAGNTGYGTVTLRMKDGTAIPAGFAADDLIVRWASYGLGASGPYSWLISTGSAFGIDVDEHAQHKSVVQTGVGVPTETKISRYLARLERAYGPDMLPNILLTSRGVQLALLDTSWGMPLRFNRALGDLNKLKMGFQKNDQSPVTYDSMPVSMLISPSMPSDADFSDTSVNGGMMWGLNTKNGNIKVYTPPRISYAKNGGVEMMPRWCQFLYGSRDIWKPLHSTTGRTTTWEEAPGRIDVEFAPGKMQGMRLEGLTELL